VSNFERKPILIDYLAGGVLTSGLGWIWLQLVNNIPNQIVFFIYAPVLVVLSGISSYIVCMKTSRDHLIIGVRTALSSWLFSVLFLLTFAFDFDLSFLLTLLVCYIVGGLGSAYIALKKLQV
jgi:hypothetical protein